VKKVMVRYKVKPEHADRNKELVRRVYEELRETAPTDIRYATFVLDDGVSFVHVATVEDHSEQNPLMRVAAFRAFQENIADRCDEPPHLEELHEVGSYSA
jgi:quinol monooxygenase YgiN